MRLQKKFPNRHIKVFCHTSGVTRRESEVPWNKFGIDAVPVDDFKNPKKAEQINLTHVTQRLFLFTKCRRVVKIGLNRFGLLRESNDEDAFRRLKPWLLFTNGHYTRISFDLDVIERMYFALTESSAKKPKQVADTIVHLRLGDLLTLSVKRPINPKKIEALITEKFNSSHLLILSDSSKHEFKEYTFECEKLSTGQFLKLSPFETIESCVAATNFIGTGAKLSLWSSMFRSVIFQRSSYLPVEMLWAQNPNLIADWY